MVETPQFYEAWVLLVTAGLCFGVGSFVGYIFGKAEWGRIINALQDDEDER